MASNLEATADAPATTADSNVAAKALITEVNNDRNTPKIDNKVGDTNSENSINKLFGSLSITGDDSKDTTGAGKTDSIKAIEGGASAKKTDALTVDPDSTAKVDPIKALEGGASARNTDALTVTPDTAAKADVTTAPADATKPTTTPGDQPTTSTDSQIARGGDKNDVPKGPEDRAKEINPADVDATALKKLQDDPQVKAAGTKLENDINKQEKGLDANSAEYKRLEDMRTNMVTLEERATKENPPLSAAEVAKTFNSVSHIMEAKDGKGVLPQSDRNDLARQVMLHAADPTTIDQGRYDTCNVATVENRMFAKNPAAAASMIDQVATTGEYKIPGEKPGDAPTTVKVPAESIYRRTDGKDEADAMPHDGERSYASEIFQVTAVNAFYKTHDLQVKDSAGKETTYPAGTVEYRLDKPDQNTTPPTPAGETLYDTRTGQPIKDSTGAAAHDPRMSAENISDTYNMISERKESGFTFVNKDYSKDAGSQLTQFGSADELRQKIEQAQKDGKMPIILNVHTGQEPFFSDTKGEAAGGIGGTHVVTITGIDKEGKAVVENQWGQQSKHSVDMGQLYVSTLEPKDAVKELKTECAKDAQNHKVDFTKEAELLRLRYVTGDLGANGNEEEYRHQLTWLTRSAVDDAIKNKGGTLDHQTEVELKSQLDHEFNNKKDVDDLTRAINLDQLTGIANGTGNVGIDRRGFESKPAADYGTKSAAEAAKDLYDAGDQTFYFNKDDYQKMDKALENKSPAEIQQMDEQFKAKYGKSMEDYIKDRFSNHKDERDKALKLLHIAQQGNDQAAA